MSAGRIILLCMVARVFFVVCCVVLVFSRFGRSELKAPIIPMPRNEKQVYPPVMEAALKSDILKLTALLEDDANPNVRSFENSTALMVVTRNGDDDFEMKAGQELLKYGARALVTDNKGMAPIHQVPSVAQFKYRNNWIHMLFLHGADLNVATYKQLAGMSNSYNTYTYDNVVKRVEIKGEPKINFTVLDVLVNFYDRTGVIDFLQNWGGMIPKEARIKTRDWAYEIGFRDIADAINAYDESKQAWRANLAARGLNQIMIGALTNDAALVTKDIGNKDTVSDDVYRRTPLHMAIMRQNPKIVELLLQAGANVNAKDYVGDTPLHKVAWLGDIIMQKKLTDLLVKYKASFTAHNERKENILHLAIRLQDLPYIQYLMSIYKADTLGLNETNAEGLTPYYLAEKVGFTDAMKLLHK